MPKPAKTNMEKTIMRWIQLDESTIKKLIPEGPYCYGPNGVCPFWSRWEDQYPHQSNGYCSLLERGDWMDSENGGTSLLWDQCKECGINDTDA